MLVPCWRAHTQLLEPYVGAMRVTVHLKGNFDRAVRLVVNPKTDTWEGFCKELVRVLKFSAPSYTVLRASSKSTITAIDQIR